MRRVIGWGVFALVAGSCSGSPAHVEAPLPARRSVPLDTVVFSGHRYVARIDVGSAGSVPLMIHGNASMYLALTHRVGERVRGGPVQKIESYGYSSRGKGEVAVDSIRVGGVAFGGRPNVPVFDFTEEGDTVVQGMLGVPFLLAARAAVDFSHDKLLLDVGPQPRPDPSLIEHGYRWVPFSITSGGRAVLEARFPAIDRTLPITPSTVSSALSLHLPLFAGRIPMTKAPSPDRSPSGTTPDEFASDSVVFEIAGVRMWSPATLEDFAEYRKVAEGELESYGMLGFDWMKEHRAVLDYANRRLYFRP